MLSQYNPVATLPTKDLSAARSFYEGTLGLTAERDDMGGSTTAAATDTSSSTSPSTPAPIRPPR